MNIIDGKQLAAAILDDVKADIAKLSHKPSLGIIVCSTDEATKKYVELKAKKASELGIQAFIAHFPPTATKDQVISQIREFNSDPTITGFLVQLPLYDHLKEHTSEILEAIDPHKDVDALTPWGQGAARLQLPHALLPATVAAIAECLTHIAHGNIEGFMKGKQVVIVNHSNLIGKPLCDYLLNLNATVTVAHKFTQDLKSLTGQADIIVLATGQPDMFDHSYFRQDAIVLDAGAPVAEVKRDQELEHKLAWLSPVPGGIGPVTVACLMRNLVVLGSRI